MRVFSAVVFGLLLSVTALGKTIEVKMLNNGVDGMMVFEPAFVRADVGDTVKFVLTDQAHASSSVFTPDGAKTWAGEINQGVSTVVDKEGVYIYECLPHAALAMVGVIQAGNATNVEAAKKFATTYAKKFAANGERLEKYLAMAGPSAKTKAGYKSSGSGGDGKTKKKKKRRKKRG
ncbi:MAG: pseudoazurin [Pseudomonadota bacterium]